MITLGGNAELELVDSLDPFSEGIIFSVMPPKKSWKNISNLSGGEKTLSSLALVFALHVFKVGHARSFSHCLTQTAASLSQLHCTSWMKSTPLSTSEMSPLLPTTSRIVRKMPSSLSSH